MKASPRIRSSRAFTLLEILVAVAILGVALTSLVGLHARNVRMAAEAQQLTIAGLLASSLIAETRAGPFPPVGSEEGRFVGDPNDVSTGFNERFGGRLGDGFVWTRQVTTTGFQNLRRVRIAVAEPDAERALVNLEVIVRAGGPP